MAALTDFAFLHGGGQGSWVWAPTVAALRAQAGPALGRVARLDVPGCGAKRGRAIGELQPADVARELIGDLEAAEVKDVVLVGHSLAGNLLPALVELRPDLFGRLVYVSCSIPRPGQTVLQLMGGGLHGESADEVGWPVDMATTPPRERYAAMFCNDMSPGQAQALLAELDQDHWPASFFGATRFEFQNLDAVPASYVVCLRDQILPVPWQERFAARFGADRLVRLDAGHQAMITRPQALAEILLQEARA